MKKRVRLGKGVRLGKCARHLFVVLAVAGCGTVPTQNYYVLTATVAPPAAAVAAGTPATLVFIDPAHLPEVVDRPQFVLGAGDANRVTILEQQRWGEPLRAAIPQVLALDLERQVPAVRVTAAAQDTLPDGAWRLTLDVQRFESKPGDAVTIEIAWTLRRAGADPGSAKSGRSTAREAVNAGDYGAIAAAASRALATISRDIATGLR
jgi:uncharacterized lipoprotein YmbA